MPWPIRGLLLFLRHPSWWLRPILGSLIGWLAVIGVGTAISWWQWPLPEVTGWHHWLGVCIALALGFATALAAWALILPLILWFALAGLARQAYRSTGREPRELDVLRDGGASMRVVLNTIPHRLGAVGIGAVGGFAGPVGVILAAIATTYVVSLDAWDLALSVAGRKGLDRLAVLRDRRLERTIGVVVGGLLLLGLSVTVIGLLLWLPALVCGAAVSVAEAEPQPAGGTGAGTGGATTGVGETKHAERG